MSDNPPTCHILRCGKPLIEFAMCDICRFKMCETCADNLVINGKQICPRCTFGGNFEGLFPGISKVRFSQDHGITGLATHQGRYQPHNTQPVYKYAVYMTRKYNNLILVFRLNDGKNERFLKFSFMEDTDLMDPELSFSSPLNAIYKKPDTFISIKLKEAFIQNKDHPTMSSLTVGFKLLVFDKFKKISISNKYLIDPSFGVRWWNELRKNPQGYDETYIDFGDDSASAASPFRPRRRSKSAKKRRNLKSKSKNKSKKRSPKPRRR